MVVVTILMLISTLISFGKGQQGPCRSFPDGCCPHTHWDPKRGKCIECSTGYYWVNCSRRCPYPLYGDLCDNACFCARYQCDFKNGCTSTKGKYLFCCIFRLHTIDTQ